MDIFYSRKRKSKINLPCSDGTAAIDKYSFLATAASGKTISAEEIGYVPSLDIDAINVTHTAITLLEVPSTRTADSNDVLIADEHPSKSSPKLTTDLTESEVNVAATSASLENVNLRTDYFESEVNPRSGSEVNVAATSASTDNIKLRTDFSESEINLTARSEFNAPSGVEVNASAGAEVNATAEAEVIVPVTSVSFDNIKLSSTIQDLLHSEPETDETVEMDPDEDGSMCARSSFSFDVAPIEDGDAGPSSDQRIGECESGSEESTTVTFYPEHMVYYDSVYTDSMISFTSSYIEIEGSSAYEDDKTFKCKWGIGDILQLSYHVHEAVEMVTVKMSVLSKGTILTEKAQCISATELKFAVIGSSWYDKLEAIISLNIQYKALWSSILESEDTALGRPGVSFSKYFPNFDWPLEEVVYPKGDADAVSISKRDFDLLQPDTFVNDTIIDFYIKYLKNNIKPEERNRFHFFNSFFFRKLADLDKDPLNASEGAAAYQRVKKWTRKVNLFQKDYVFVPVNYSLHWSLIVMCHLGELATYDDKDANESIKVPCVLHMDSLRDSHIGLKGLVQSYLREEWKGRQDVASEHVASKFDNLRFIYLELPQQQNLYDCGLFLLHYVELFLEQAPQHFNPFKITESTNFLNGDWFPPAEASLKRVVIQKLIGDLLNNPYQKTSSDAINDKERYLSCPTTNVHKGTTVNLSPEDYNPSIPHQSFRADFELGVASSTPIRADDPIVGLNPCFGSESDFGIHFTDCNQSATFDENEASLTPIEEDVEDGGQFIYSQTECGTQPDNGIISDDFALNFPSSEMYNDETLESLSEASIRGSEESMEIVNEKSQQLDLERDEAVGDSESFMDMHANTDPSNSIRC